MNTIKSIILFILGPALWLGEQVYYRNNFRQKPEGWVEWRLTILSILTIGVYVLLKAQVETLYPDSIWIFVLMWLISLNVVMAFVSLLFLQQHLRNNWH
jgi:hypothetical protein